MEGNSYWLGWQQPNQQAQPITNSLSHVPYTPPLVHLGTSASQHKHTKQNSKNDTSITNMHQYQNQNDTAVSASNSFLHCQYGRTSSIPAGGPPVYTPSSTHTISWHTKPTILQHTQTAPFNTLNNATVGINSLYSNQSYSSVLLNPSIGGGVPDVAGLCHVKPKTVHQTTPCQITQYHTPLHQINNATAGINSSYNNQFDTTVALKPVSDAVAGRTPDATSDTPPFGHHKDITTAASSAFRTPAITNHTYGRINNSASSDASKHQHGQVRAAVVTPTNEIVNKELDFLMKRWQSFDIDTMKAIVARLDAVVNGTDSDDEKSHKCTELYSHQQNDGSSCELPVKVIAKDTSTLDEEVDETVVCNVSYNDDVGGIDNMTPYKQSTVDLESDENGGVNNDIKPTHANYNDTINADSATDEEKEDTSSNEVFSEEVDVDQLGSVKVTYVPFDEEEDTEEDCDESADQQTSSTLDKIADWIVNDDLVTQYLDSLVSEEAKEKLKDEGRGIAKIMTPIVKISSEEEKIGELLAEIGKGKLSAVDIGVILKHHSKDLITKAGVFKTCLLDNTQTNVVDGDTKAPIVFGVGRGSKGTNNTGSTQCRNFSEAALVSVRTGILPKNTRLCTTYFFAHEQNKDKMHHAPALWHLIWSILHVNQNVQVILAMNELKRFGRGQLLNELISIILEIHPNTKIISVRECFMHPNDVTNNNEEEILGYSSIADDLGSNRGQNNGVDVSDDEQERLDRINRRAKVRAKDILAIAKKGLILKNILDGLKRGRETSDVDESNRKNLKLVVNNVCSLVQDEHTLLNEQPNGIDVELAIKEELDEHMPIQNNNNNNRRKAALIYIRRTIGALSRSAWGVSLWQLALAIEAGIEDGCITKDTELIIISEDDVARTNELNSGYSRAMSRIRAGGVSAFIEASTLRGTSRRVAHNTLEVICEEAGTKVILAAQSSDSKYIRMMHAEIEQKRQHALADKTEQYYETDDYIRSKLSHVSPVLYRLSVFFSIMSRTVMKKSEHLFKEELEAAKKQRADEKKKKKADAEKKRKAAGSVGSEKGKKKRRELDESRAIDPTDDDVLSGRGGLTNTHPGNIKFRAKALELRPRYEIATLHRRDKEAVNIAKLLIESVKAEGGRFLEKGQNGLWHEVLDDDARKKASILLQDCARERPRRERPQSPKWWEEDEQQSNTPVVAAPVVVGTLADLEILYPTKTKKKSKTKKTAHMNSNSV